MLLVWPQDHEHVYAVCWLLTLITLLSVALVLYTLLHVFLPHLHLVFQKVDGPGSLNSANGRRGKYERHNSKDIGRRRDSVGTEPGPLRPGSGEDSRVLRELLSTPAKGVTVLCVDPPARYVVISYRFAASAASAICISMLRYI